MTIYNPILDQSPSPPSLQADTANYVFGYYFTASAPCQINGVWWFFVAAGGNQYNNSGGDEQIALWTVTGSGSAGENYIAGTAVTAGTYVNGWNFIPYASPIALTAGTEYIAVKGIAPHTHALDGYCATGSAFHSTGAWTNGIADGPVLVYSSGNVADGTGSSNQEPFGNGQMQFFTISGSTLPDVTANAPNAVFAATWYGMDIQIQTASAPPPGGATITYGMRLS
jgi:hypothetical protein